MAEPKLKTAIADILGGVWKSPIGILGVIITTVSAGLLLYAVGSDLLTGGLGPYEGLVTYLFLPAIFVAGLLLMPIGYLLSRRAEARQKKPIEAKLFVIDLRDPKQQRFVVFVAFMTVINIALILTASYGGYHYTESTKFCGQLCHSVMKPEYTAYKRSPHARVDCVECHIGAGASWFVKAKLSGLRQVYGVLADDFSRPIPTPIHNLRPARETCEQCHWPEVFHGNRTKVLARVPDAGDPLDPELKVVLLHVGGRDQMTGQYHGIHWHVSRDVRVEYRANDSARNEIRDVRVIKTDGTSEQFSDSEMPEPPAGAEWHAMDCVDCHNRPTHVFYSAEHNVDRVILQKRIDGALPENKKDALEAVQAEYPTQDAARDAIRQRLLTFYGEKYSEVATQKKQAIEDAAKVLFDDVYAGNVYPELKIKWGTYVSRLGHTDSPGCFRCHSGKHKSAAGKEIGQDCDLCHSVLVDGDRASAVDSTIKQYID